MWGRMCNGINGLWGMAWLARGMLYNRQWAMSPASWKGSNIMTLTQAKLKAARYSIRYGVWYVRRIRDNEFEPYAYSSDDSDTVACFIAGKESDE